MVIILFVSNLQDPKSPTYRLAYRRQVIINMITPILLVDEGRKAFQKAWGA